MWRLPIWILLWVLFIALNIPVVLFGVIMVPLVYRYVDVLYDRLPWWTRPWANPEDHFGGPMSYEGSLPKWWVLQHGIGAWSFFRYHALRNPANGLRSFEVLDLDIDPYRVEYITKPAVYPYYEPWWLRENHPDIKTAWYICWQGFRAGAKYIHVWKTLEKDVTLFGWTLLEAGPRHFVAKFGWKVEPRDRVVPIDSDGLRDKDAGFSSKFLPYRQG